MNPTVLSIAVLSAILALPVHAGERELDDLSLEELVKLEVASVARKAQKLSDTPAAVTVLSADDIRRSGARSIPEALREVPGVNVAQIGAARWAVSVRGFNGRFSNKLLVQIDGRSVYSPLFSGVFWEAIDVLLEDVERIEVVRGPGASLWGANAVNGIINIVTRKATATQGTLASVTVDDRGAPVVAARQGFTLANGAALRVFAKGGEISSTRREDGDAVGDKLTGWLAGFRMDSAVGGRNTWSLQGNAYRRSGGDSAVGLVAEAPSGNAFAPQFDGANLLGRYNWGLAGGEATLQAYLDRQQADVGSYGTGAVTTADLDLQHRLAPVGKHALMWGLGYRAFRAEIESRTPMLWMTPNRRDSHIASAFAQDEITLLPRRLMLTLGGRFEYSSLSGFEPQPTVRLMWTPTTTDSVWAGWSRAARTPSIGETDANLVNRIVPLPPGFGPTSAAIVSQPAADWNRRAERVVAVETGYRRNLGNGSVEAVLFHQRYSGLIGGATDPAGLIVPGIAIGVPPGYLPIQRLLRSNNVSGCSSGLELGMDVPVTAWFRLQASYTLMNTSIDPASDVALATFGGNLKYSAPNHWASVHGVFALGGGRDVDLMLRRVGRVGEGDIPAYTAVDLRYAWKLNRTFELAVVGQNLFDPLHLEYVSDVFPGVPAYLPRRGFVQGVWRY